MVFELYGLVCLPKGTAKAENLISSSAGLDVSKVYFSLWTVPEFQTNCLSMQSPGLLKLVYSPYMSEHTNKERLF
jgi:hypothetical protein